MAGDDGEGDDDMMAGLHFTEEVTAQAYTAGTAITDLVLPEAMGGEGDVTYQVFGLPAGLAFDAATRTISGTPEAAGVAEVNYLATDSAGEDEALQFSITVNPALSFGDLFGAGKIVPDSHGLTEIREFVIGQRVEGLTLPEGTGGTAPLTYSLSPALPAGLTFDAVTRTIAGTPQSGERDRIYVHGHGRQRRERIAGVADAAGCILLGGQLSEPVQPSDDDPVCVAAGGGRGTDRV